MEKLQRVFSKNIDFDYQEESYTDAFFAKLCSSGFRCNSDMEYRIIARHLAIKYFSIKTLTKQKQMVFWEKKIIWNSGISTLFG